MVSYPELLIQYGSLERIPPSIDSRTIIRRATWMPPPGWTLFDSLPGGPIYLSPVQRKVQSSKWMVGIARE